MKLNADSRRALMKSRYTINTPFSAYLNGAIVFTIYFLSLCSINTLAGITSQAPNKCAILISTNATHLQLYAAKELQRYILQISDEFWEIKKLAEAQPQRAIVIGTIACDDIRQKYIATGILPVDDKLPGEQGYLLKRHREFSKDILFIIGGDDCGVLYGVYGLLEDHFDVRFYISGDVIPKIKGFNFPDVNMFKRPAVYIRGFLPWINFPQSATSWSWEDWKYIIDQTARMRMNFILVHNCNGELGHNEMFHNFSVNGELSRVWFATARSGHAWGGRPGWDPNRYLFGANLLFDDYDFGSDCALHNENLSSYAVFRKGVSLFQKILHYAHSRGVKIGLGLDINLIPDFYKLQPEDPQVIAARVAQIIIDYPELDYLFCFQSETINEKKDGRKIWRNIFDGFYNTIKNHAPNIRLAVAGWGIKAEDVATLPPDVICAPISEYSDSCESGEAYGVREYWGCPWLERDFNSSLYYYPYNMHLTNTINAWLKRAPNMKGFYCLTWRLADAVEPKLWYISKAPWDSENKLATADSVYLDYSRHNYSKKYAPLLASILNTNEPYASNFSECEQTPGFFPGGTSGYLLNVAWFRFKGDNTNQKYSAASYTQMSGIRKAKCDEGGECIGWIEQGDWARYDDINVGTNSYIFEARVASSRFGGLIEIRLDSPTGELIGVCRVTNTGGWQKWQTVQTTIKPISGLKDICLRFMSAPSPTNDFEKAMSQIALVEYISKREKDPANRYRLDLLKSRISAAKQHIFLNENFHTLDYHQLAEAVAEWVKIFITRVNDISSLGNVVSVQNRFIQKTYLARADELERSFPVCPPTNVVAYGLPTGAILRFQNAHSNVIGFNIYRNKVKINASPLPPDKTEYIDNHNGFASYSITAIDAQGNESPHSVYAFCKAGKADNEPPQIIVISPQTTIPAGGKFQVKARCIDNRDPQCLSVYLYFRKFGSKEWTKLMMTRRVKAIFTATISQQQLNDIGIEYYIEATDGNNVSEYPQGAPRNRLSAIVTPVKTNSQPYAPQEVRVAGKTIKWSPVQNARWYRIYRGSENNFVAGAHSYLTYVDAATTEFTDNEFDFEGNKLYGTMYYIMTAVTIDDVESPSSQIISITYK